MMDAFTQSLPANLSAGIVVSILELLFIYLLLRKLLQRTENKRWEVARREFSARVLFYAHSLSAPLAYYIRCEGDTVLVKNDFISALEHIKEISHRFDVLVSHYASAITAEWFIIISVTADELRSVAVCADIAANNWDPEYVDGVHEDGNFADTELRNDAWVYPIGKALAERKTYQLPDDKVERQRLILGQHLYICCDQIALLSAQMLTFATTTYQPAELRDTECFSRKTYWHDGPNVEKHMTLIDQDVHFLQHCAQQMSAGKLYLSRGKT